MQAQERLTLESNAARRMPDWLLFDEGSMNQQLLSIEAFEFGDAVSWTERKYFSVWKRIQG